VIKVTNLDRVPENNRLRSEIARVNGILIDSYLDRLEVNALINHCDIYISLHRSEGYGLTMAEAMYLGKPVIGTAYSGNADFMNDENSYLVPFKIVELGKPYPPYDADNVWAEADVQVAARYLREIYDDPESANAKRAAAGSFIREYYSLKVRGGKVAEQLNKIHTKYFSSKAEADVYEAQH
jgi:glycosyltransferase involved in cell wall biosynthesis